MKILWCDTETTGLDPKLNDIISIAFLIEENGVVLDKLYLKIQPINWNNISQEALDINGFTIEQLKTFLHPKEAHRLIVAFFSKYIDKFKKNKTIEDKLVIAGYNVLFDNQFLSEFFKKCGDNYLGSFIDYHKLDIASMVLFLKTYKQMDVDGFKLLNIANYFNTEINAHDALSDIEATREIAYKIINKIDFKN